MRRLVSFGLAGLVSFAAGCSSSETKPAPSPAAPAAETYVPDLVPVPLTITNGASDARLVWIESYKAGPTEAPMNSTEAGTLAAGESKTVTVPVPQGGSFRVLGAKPTGAPGDRRVVFMGKITKAAGPATVKVDR